MAEEKNLSNYEPIIDLGRLGSSPYRSKSQPDSERRSIYGEDDNNNSSRSPNPIYRNLFSLQEKIPASPFPSNPISKPFPESDSLKIDYGIIEIVRQNIAETLRSAKDISNILPSFDAGDANRFFSLLEKYKNPFVPAAAFATSRAIDDLGGVLRGSIVTLFTSPTRRRAIEEVGKIVGGASGYTESTLSKIYGIESAQFLGLLADSLATVEQMSTSRIAGVLPIRGREKPRLRIVRVNPGEGNPGELLAYTHYSETPKINDRRKTDFDARIVSNIAPTAHQGLYEMATILRDRSAREVMVAGLREIQKAKGSRIEVVGETYVADVVFQGLSLHASNAASVLRYLRPDLELAGVDRYNEPGHLWNTRFWLEQNNTMGSADVSGNNLPRQGGDLFPTGHFGAMRVPYISDGRWPLGSDAGTCIEYNLTRDLDSIVLGCEVEKVERVDSDYVVKMKDQQGRTRIIRAKTIIASGIGKQKNPFRVDDGEVDSESVTIWEEEVAKSNDGILSLCFTYDSFSETLMTREGKEWFLREVKEGSARRARVNGVAGAEDGGRSVVEYMLFQSRNPAAYEGLLIQSLGKKPKMLWWGQKLSSAAEYGAATRGRYSRICSGYTSQKIETTPRKIGAVRRYNRNGNSSVFPFFPLTGYERMEDGSIDFGNPKSMDTFIASTGLVPVKDQEIYGNLAIGGRKKVLDQEGRAVMSKLAGEQIYFIGPASAIPASEAGSDVLKVFEDLGLPENQVAAWWRSFATQRAAIYLASDVLPTFNRRMQYRQGK